MDENILSNFLEFTKLAMLNGGQTGQATSQASQATDFKPAIVAPPIASGALPPRNGTAGSVDMPSPGVQTGPKPVTNTSKPLK